MATAWITCPTCNGAGLGPTKLNEQGFTIKEMCSTCDNSKIVHNATGLPPGERKEPFYVLVGGVVDETI